MTDVNFQLKGTTITVIVLELNRYLPNSFPQELATKIQQAPQFFDQSPLLINLEKLADDDLAVDFNLLLDQCRQLNLQPVAFKGAGERFSAAVRDSGLALLPEARTPVTARELTLPEPPVAASAENGSEDNVVIKTVIQERLVHNPTKVITRPVRSGQQVYAEASDLVILSNVSEGAEVLADGNIHVYGALRGRALAGVRGNEQARIFCQQMEAELISVAGNFLPSDAIDQQVRKQTVQVYLQGETLNVERL